MHIYLYSMKCQPKQVDKGKYLTLIKHFDSVRIKENSNVMNITLYFNSGNFDSYKDIISECNYCYIKGFNRYYFIDDFILNEGKILGLKCSIDVLYTYSDKILNTAQFIERNANKYNGLYLDEFYPITQKKEMKLINTNLGFNLPSTNDLSIAMTVTGGV